MPQAAAVLSRERKKNDQAVGAYFCHKPSISFHGLGQKHGVQCSAAVRKVCSMQREGHDQCSRENNRVHRLYRTVHTKLSRGLESVVDTHPQVSCKRNDIWRMNHHPAETMCTSPTQISTSSIVQCTGYARWLRKEDIKLAKQSVVQNKCARMKPEIPTTREPLRCV